MKQSGDHGVNLLPLLDVLLCTMGTLIVVLGVVNRQARLNPGHAARAGNASVTADAEDTAIAQEQLELRIEQLTAASAKTAENLDLARRRLSGIEDHSRQMKDQLRGLVTAAKELEKEGDPESEAHRALRDELAALQSRRAQLEEELMEARDGVAKRKPCYAIVPFEGVYRTNRRPIYIECRGDSVILQPEGIVLGRSDFLGPPGPGNPLAAALRAAREYWGQLPSNGEKSEPYPLLLVRPDGVIAYYLAREAMASWGSEFGYELVDADWKLDFPEQPAARLVAMEKRAVAEARQQLEWLAQVSPEAFERRQRKQYRASPIRGGVVRDGGPSLGNDPFADDALGGFGRPGGMNTGQSPDASDGPNAGPGSNQRGGGAEGTGGGSEKLARAGAPGNSHGAGFGGSDSASGKNSLTGGMPSMVGPRYAGAGAGTTSTGTFAVTGRDGRRGNGEHSSGPGNDGNRLGSRSGAANGSSDAQSGSGNDTSGSDEPGSRTPGSSAQGGASGAQSGSPGGQPGSAAQSASTAMGTPMPSIQFDEQQTAGERPDRESHSIAVTRGRNWAMPNSNSSVPITRPIRVECRGDRLVVVPDVRDQQPVVIPLSKRTGESVDQLVAAVREQTRTWGIAGRGMYWKPQLVLDVTSDGAGRAADLQILLADSGLDVKRKR